MALGRRNTDPNAGRLGDLRDTPIPDFSNTGPDFLPTSGFDRFSTRPPNTGGGGGGGLGGDIFDPITHLDTVTVDPGKADDLEDVEIAPITLNTSDTVTIDPIETPVIDDVEIGSIGTPDPIEEDTPDIDQLIKTQTNLAFDRLGATAESARLAEAQRIAASSTMTEGAKRAARAGLERDISSATAQAAGDTAVAAQQLKVNQANIDKEFQLKEDITKGYWKTDPVTGEKTWIKGTAEIDSEQADLIKQQGDLKIDDQILKNNELGTAHWGTMIGSHIDTIEDAGGMTDVNGDGVIDVEDWLSDGTMLEYVKNWWKYAGDGEEWTGSPSQIDTLDKLIKGHITSDFDKNVEDTKEIIDYDNLTPEEQDYWDTIFKEQGDFLGGGGVMKDILDKDGNVIGLQYVDRISGENITDPTYFDGFGPDDAVGLESDDSEDGDGTPNTIDFDPVTGIIISFDDDGKPTDITATYDPGLSDHAFHPVSNMIIDAGRDVNPELYDIVLATRVDFLEGELALAPIDKNFLSTYGLTEFSPEYQAMVNDPKYASTDDVHGFSFQWEHDNMSGAFDAGNKASDERNILGFFEGQNIDGQTDPKFDNGEVFIYNGRLYIFDRISTRKTDRNNETTYYFFDAITGEEYWAKAPGGEGEKKVETHLPPARDDDSIEDGSGTGLVIGGGGISNPNIQ